MPKKTRREVSWERAQRAMQARVAKLGKARQSFTRLQFISGICLLLSSFFGVYLLATDKSLWILAVSHAYGLLAIVGISLEFGILNVLGVRRGYLLSVAGALLGVLLQIGDILTAPQYGMTIAYFASYLFSLWPFDALLASQLLVVLLGLLSRVHIRTLKTDWRYSPAFSASRKEFLKGMMAFAIVVALASTVSIFGETKQTLPPNSGTGTNSTGTGGGGGGSGTGGGGGSGSGGPPQGSIANQSQVQPGSPVYFEYPIGSGNPNILMRKTDGTLIALSLLCTHVCCQLTYDSTNTQLDCPCHYSVFDQNGNVVQGPANVPLPTVQIRTDSNGYIFPVQVVGSSPCIS